MKKIISFIHNIREFSKLKKEHKEVLLNFDYEDYLQYQNLNDTTKKILVDMPLGHFYSPIPNIEEIKNNEDRVFENDISELSGIDLNIEDQVDFAKELTPFIVESPFTEEKVESRRFFHKNPSLNELDSLVLHAMLRRIKPKNLIEIGSGYSSAMTLDTNEIFLENKIKCKFIEPFPQTLYSLLKESDKIDIIEKKLQDVPLDTFDILEEGDILFVDSTHVSKIGSDVNYMFFKVLPRLKKGVIIHFHDILFPFSYPKPWIYETFFHWNEAFLLRAFLQYNDVFKLKLWAPLLYKRNIIDARLFLPIKRKHENPMDAGSIWIEKQK